jgi:hypothetical protein
MTIDLELLGMTREELQQRVVERIADSLLAEKSEAWDEETGEPYINSVESKAIKTLKQLIKDRVDGRIKQMADEHVLPKVAEMVETITFEETNRWGERVKSERPLTFREYLVLRAEAYMREEVDYQGKAKPERDSYSWTKEGTRIAHMVHEHLHYEIKHAMEQAVKSVNSALADGIASTVKIKLEEITKGLKVAVTTR